jgi:hypothetical protein
MAPLQGVVLFLIKAPRIMLYYWYIKEMRSGRLIINGFVSNKKLVLDFNNFIVSIDYSAVVNSIVFDETDCSLLLDTLEGYKYISIEELLLNQCSYETEVIGCLNPCSDDIKLYLKTIKSINWLGVIG